MPSRRQPGPMRLLESVDRSRMSVELYPVLVRMLKAGAIDADRAANVIAASAEGYPFPTNRDSDPPIGGLAPETQQALFRRALDEDWGTGAFINALADQAAKRLA
jgi:hypothetical protein